MSNLASPFDSILQQAAQLKPTGHIDRYAERLNYNSEVFLILLDVSGSMAEFVGPKRKIDLMLQALDRIHAGERLLAFSTVAEWVQNIQQVPSPSGGTAMHFAIAEAVILRPKQTLIISDGLPDSEDQALEQAARLTGIINTLYVGPDDDLQAIAFMQKLARLGCGKSVVSDLSKVNLPKLTQTTHSLRALPEGKF